VLVIAGPLSGCDAVLERRAPQILTEIRDKKEISDSLRETVAKAITDARTEFVAAKGIKAA